MQTLKNCNILQTDLPTQKKYHDLKWLFNINLVAMADTLLVCVGLQVSII